MAKPMPERNQSTFLGAISSKESLIKSQHQDVLAHHSGFCSTDNQAKGNMSIFIHEIIQQDFSHILPPNGLSN